MRSSFAARARSLHGLWHPGPVRYDFAMATSTRRPERPQAAQVELFAPALPDGLIHARDFLVPEEEAELLRAFGGLAFHEARYKAYTAKRRIVSFGSSYDFGENVLHDAPPLPSFLLPLRAKAAAWAQLPAERFTDALIAEYAPGTQLGWHRDVPQFEHVVGISLAGECRMRFRPYPGGDFPGSVASYRASTFDITLEPRSAYILQREIRWRWQHMIPPTRELRYSITFRTRRERRPG
jgi:alkylated DNA repair dioxygenase AlkB